MKSILLCLIIRGSLVQAQVGPQTFIKSSKLIGGFFVSMNSACYILFSQHLQKFYVGATHDDIALRIEKHNLHAYGNHRFTATANDWELFLLIHANDYPHAIRIERKIKAMKSAKYIKNLKQYPELILKLVNGT